MAIQLRDAVSFRVEESSQVGEARRAATVLSQRLGFDATQAGEVAIVVTEAGQNLVRHGGGGEIVLRPMDRKGVLGLEILALDKGPGLGNILLSLQDGYSTSTTPGTGLGAIKRLSTEFEVFSSKGLGTVIMSRFWVGGAAPEATGGYITGVVCLPLPTEEANGDAWTLLQQDGRVLIALADGLGHGPNAAEASGRAITLVQENSTLDLIRLVERLHSGLRSTRGAAVALVELTPPSPLLKFVGVGNIAGSIVDGTTSRSVASHNGTVGAEMRRTQRFDYELPPNGLLILSSDGLATQWNLANYPGLINKHPALIAAVLYRDHRRIRDDVTVLVLRQEKA